MKDFVNCSRRGPRHEGTMAILEIRLLKTHFKTPHGIARAVDGVTLDAHEGRVLDIVGESGCGKSVLALFHPEAPSFASWCRRACWFSP